MKVRYCRLAALLACAPVILITFAGCSTPPRVNPEEAAGQLAGLDSAIQFSMAGGPIDEKAPEEGLLSVGTAIERAVRSDPRIQAAIARVRAAQAAARQERLLPNPVLNFVLRFPEGGGSPAVEVGLTADLVSLLAKPGRIGMADSRLRAAAADVETTVLDVIAEVQERYVAVQAAEGLRAVMRERLEILDRLVSITRSRVEAGEGTRLDLISIQSQKLDLTTEIADVDLRLREDRLILARLIGQPSSAANWRMARWEPPLKEVVPEAGWIKVGLENRPELRKQVYELCALGQEVRLAGLSAFEGASVGPAAERDGGQWSVGPGVSTPIPLFDWGQERRQQAQAAVAEARHKLTETSRQVVEETRRSFTAYQMSFQNVERIRNELLPLSRQRLRQAETQFRLGQSDITALLQAEELSRAANIRLIESEKQNASAYIRLQRSVGGRVAMSAVRQATPGESTSRPTTFTSAIRTEAVRP